MPTDLPVDAIVMSPSLLALGAEADRQVRHPSPLPAPGAVAPGETARDLLDDHADRVEGRRCRPGVAVQENLYQVDDVTEHEQGNASFARPYR